MADIRGPVLIVEDNAEARDLLERVLLIRGFDVVPADDAVDALAYLERGGRAAAVVLDLAMPYMDGITFRGILSDDERWAAIPVVVYTGLTSLDVPSVAGVFRKGTDDPQRLIDLLERISQTAP